MNDTAKKAEAAMERFVDGGIRHFRKLDGSRLGSRSEGDDSGPMSIGKPQAAAKAGCELLERRVARLIRKMSP